MSNSLDPDQAQQNVGPDLGQNCLQTLSADDTHKQTKSLEIETCVFVSSKILKIRSDCGTDII